MVVENSQMSYRDPMMSNQQYANQQYGNQQYGNQQYGMDARQQNYAN